MRIAEVVKWKAPAICQSAILLHPILCSPHTKCERLATQGTADTLLPVRSLCRCVYVDCPTGPEPALYLCGCRADDFASQSGDHFAHAYGHISRYQHSSGERRLELRRHVGLGNGVAYCDHQRARVD